VSRSSRTAPRLFVVVALLATLLSLLSASAEATTAGARRISMRTLETRVVARMNALRMQHGLRPLRVSWALRRAAWRHSLSMAQRGYFTHESADGTAFWRRVERYYGSRGFRYWSVGENLLWSSPDIGAAEAVSTWLASPEHRENLFAREWREVGLAAIHVASAPGVYGGRPVTIMTADFGVRTR
jgi:uncharacterized protein YkwD